MPRFAERIQTLAKFPPNVSRKNSGHVKLSHAGTDLKGSSDGQQGAGVGGRQHGFDALFAGAYNDFCVIFVRWMVLFHVK